jgi:Mn-dependent DtxR family transcriptional regulator
MYARSQRIEERLRTVVELVGEGRYSTSQLAAELGISVPTVSRCIGALRDRGYRIRAVHRLDGWAYTLASADGNNET